MSSSESGATPGLDPFASPLPEILKLLRRLHRVLDLHSRSLSREHGLTGPQLVTLQEVARRGEASLVEVASGVSVSPATLTGIVERLEARGLVRRRRSARDRRRYLLRPTSSGRTVAAAASPLPGAFVDRFGRLREAEQRRLLRCLRRLDELMATPVAVATERQAPVDRESRGA